MHTIKIKREIAKASPYGFAAIIQNRNELLLGLLEKWYAEINANKAWATAEKRRDVQHGCPHCIIRYGCDKCLWTKTIKRVEGIKEKISKFGCCRVAFKGITYQKVSNSRGFKITYWKPAATISFYHCGITDFRDSYRCCKKFLQGHIEWSKIKEWKPALFHKS